MTTKKLEQLWQQFPESHLHCDVTRSGLHSYGLVASLINHNGDVIAQVEHYGSGDLDILKEQAFRLLAVELDNVATV